jgi:hypothetical protein
MKRLRELATQRARTEHKQPWQDNVQLEQAKALLDAVGPLPNSRARMTRIWRALEQGPPARRRPHRRLTLLLAAGLVFALTALAAAQGASAIRAILASVTQGEPSVLRTPEKAKAPRRGPKQVPARAAPSQAQPPAPAEPSPASPSPAQVTRAQPAERSAAREPKEARASDAELVRLAVIALRRDGDGERAGRLLEQAYAGGAQAALAEEVLSLRVEAASLRADPRAASYARQYLARYPNGRYRARVEQALH